MSDPLFARSVVSVGKKPVAYLENEFVRYSFMPAKCGDDATIIPKIEYCLDGQWIAAEADAGAEIYGVVKNNVKSIKYSGTFPLWVMPSSPPVDVKFGDITITTSRSLNPPEIWRAGEFLRFQPVGAKLEDNVVTIDFAPQPEGQLSAEWRLASGKRAANVKLKFVPAAKGSYSLGYHMFFRRTLADVQELQMPLAFQRRRFPLNPLYGA